MMWAYSLVFIGVSKLGFFGKSIDLGWFVEIHFSKFEILNLCARYFIVI